MDDVPLCPDWWPKLIWDLHVLKRPWPVPPINLPIIMDEIFSQLAAHTMTYTMRDQKLAQTMRTQLEANLSETVRNLSKLHDEAVAMR